MSNRYLELIDKNQRQGLTDSEAFELNLLQSALSPGIWEKDKEQALKSSKSNTRKQ